MKKSTQWADHIKSIPHLKIIKQKPQWVKPEIRVADEVLATIAFAALMGVILFAVPIMGVMVEFLK